MVCFEFFRTAAINAPVPVPTFYDLRPVALRNIISHKFTPACICFVFYRVSHVCPGYTRIFLIFFWAWLDLLHDCLSVRENEADHDPAPVRARDLLQVRNAPGIAL